MCIILFSYKNHHQYKLILASNRDEFKKRRTKPAHFWAENKNILAGQDLEHYGTWLGVTKTGRIGALTNFRAGSTLSSFGKPHVLRKKTDIIAPYEIEIEEGRTRKPFTYSRGLLVSEFLESDKTSFSYMFDVSERAHEYDPFNLIVGTTDKLQYFCSKEKQIYEIPSGIHGLSNSMINTPWPKVKDGVKAMEKALYKDRFTIDELFTILTNQDEVYDEDLPETGLEWDWERELARIFVNHKDYHTQSSTVILWDYNDEVTFIERTYKNGRPGEFKEKKFEFCCEL